MTNFKVLSAWKYLPAYCARECGLRMHTCSNNCEAATSCCFCISPRTKLTNSSIHHAAGHRRRLLSFHCKGTGTHSIHIRCVSTRCLASSNRCLTSSNKKLVVTGATLVVPDSCQSLVGLVCLFKPGLQEMLASEPKAGQFQVWVSEVCSSHFGVARRRV